MDCDSEEAEFSGDDSDEESEWISNDGEAEGEEDNEQDDEDEEDDVPVSKARSGTPAIAAASPARASCQVCRAALDLGRVAT